MFAALPFLAPFAFLKIFPHFSDCIVSFACDFGQPNSGVNQPLGIGVITYFYFGMAYNKIERPIFKGLDNDSFLQA
jgi:hypothetical protein